MLIHESDGLALLHKLIEAEDAAKWWSRQPVAIANKIRIVVLNYSALQISQVSIRAEISKHTMARSRNRRNLPFLPFSLPGSRCRMSHTHTVSSDLNISRRFQHTKL